jgi:hypothetical protein
MIAVEKVSKIMRESQHSLDVGGWHKPMNGATHVIDINDYDTRLIGQALDYGEAERFTKDTWLQRDICDREPWPYPDNYFDFVSCSHVLEDIRDPVWVVQEISRVGRAGYIECPNAPAELLVYQSLFSQIFKDPKKVIGCSHHRWLVDFKPEESSIIFRFKLHDLLENHRFVSVSEFHSVDWDNYASYIFWENQVIAKEEIFDIGEWIDSVALPKTKELVKFAPVERIKDKLSRLIQNSDRNTYKQPNHGDGCKYPYL